MKIVRYSDEDMPDIDCVDDHGDIIIFEHKFGAGIVAGDLVQYIAGDGEGTRLFHVVHSEDADSDDYGNCTQFIVLQQARAS